MMRVLFALGTIALGGCSLLVATDGLTGSHLTPDAVEAGAVNDTGAAEGGDVDAGDPGADAASDAGDSADANDSADASDGAPSEPAVIASISGATAPTGMAQQSHLAWLTHAGLWMFVYFDAADPMRMKTRTSADFATWSDGPFLDLPFASNGDGRDLALTAADLGGRDVLHAALSLLAAPGDRRVVHVRATVAAGAPVLEAPSTLASLNNADTHFDPDGPATAIASDGTVFAASGWSPSSTSNNSGGDEVVWRGTAPEVGGASAWPETWSAAMVVKAVPIIVNARAFVPLAAGAMLAVWEAGDAEPAPTNLNASVFSGGTWSPITALFTAATQSANDWGIAASSPTDVHVVRRTTAGAYEHVRFNGATWGPGAAMTAQPGVLDSGVVLIPAPTRVYAATIADDAARSVRIARFENGLWSDWSTLVGTPAPRTYLTCTVGGGQAALAWAEGVNVVGVRMPL